MLLVRIWPRTNVAKNAPQPTIRTRNDRGKGYVVRPRDFPKAFTAHSRAEL